MNKKTEKKIQNDEEFQKIIGDLIKNETVLEMKKYKQHYETNCFEHCYIASYYCYKIAKKHKLDYKSAARAAMLHDLFLYDWRVPGTHNRLHAFHHPRTAYNNAIKLFDLNEKEKDIILKHMWPLTVIPPKYKESFILTLVDKYCVFAETKKYFSEKRQKHLTSKG